MIQLQFLNDIELLYPLNNEDTVTIMNLSYQFTHEELDEIYKTIENDETSYPTVDDVITYLTK